MELSPKIKKSATILISFNQLWFLSYSHKSSFRAHLSNIESFLSFLFVSFSLPLSRNSTNLIAKNAIFFAIIEAIKIVINFQINTIKSKRTYYRNDPRDQLFRNQNKYFALRILSRSRHNFVLIYFFVNKYLLLFA